MHRQAGRRRVKKRRGREQNNRMKFCGFLGIIGVAVLLGYLTARFVVGPLIGYDSGESLTQISENEEEASSSKSNEEEQSGYALQFGAFSTKDAAESLAESLKKQGVKTEIKEQDGKFKVLSPIIQSKEEALEALKELPDIEIEDVFVTAA